LNFQRPDGLFELLPADPTCIT